MTTHGMTRKHHQFSVNTSENRELIAWAVIIVILVISAIACYLLWGQGQRHGVAHP